MGRMRPRLRMPLLALAAVLAVSLTTWATRATRRGGTLAAASVPEALSTSSDDDAAMRRPSASAAVLDPVASPVMDAVRAPSSQRVEAPPPDDEDSIEAPVRGIVVDANGDAIAGAVVEIELDLRSYFDFFDGPHFGERRAAYATTRTDRVGRFQLPASGRAMSLVRARAAGRCESTIEGVMPGADLRFVLSEGAFVTGAITDMLTGAPVADARVVVLHGSEPMQVSESTTDANGHYALGELCAGEGHVFAVPLEHAASAAEELTLLSGTSLRVDLQVSRGWTFAGQVRDADTGAWLEGARVGLVGFSGKAVTTDSEGRYRMPGVSENITTVFAEARSYGRTEYPLPEARADLGSDFELDIDLRRGLSVTGRVVDARGRPILDALPAAVACVDATLDGAYFTRTEWRRASVDPEGRFVLTPVRVDLPVSVQVRAPGYGMRLFPIDAAQAREGRVELGDLVLAPHARVMGRVLDAGGQPVSDALLLLRRTDVPDQLMTAATLAIHRGRTTDRDGRFTFVELDAGAWELTAEAFPHGTTAPYALELQPGDARRSVVLAFGEVHRLRGTVVDSATGSGLAGAWVEVLPNHAGTLFPCDEQGAFLIEGLQEGEITVRALVPEDALPWAYGTATRSGIPDEGAPWELRLQRLDVPASDRSLGGG